MLFSSVSRRAGTMTRYSGLRAAMSSKIRQSEGREYAMVLPKEMLQYSTVLSKECQTGRTDSHVAPGAGLMLAWTEVTLCMMLPWESITPLGRPVVPDV